MSTQHKTDFVDVDVTEEEVHGYLEQNPDFFERHSALLGSLRLPHNAGGTVSLVERQVSLLRQRDLKLERQLKELLEVARDNDALAGKIHALVLSLLAAGDLVTTLAAIEESLRTAFDADHSILVLFGDPDAYGEVSVGRFFKPVAREDDGVQTFDTFLAGSGPRCGQVRDAQRDFLFGKSADEIGSAALIPLGDKSELGFLVIGSNDAERFHPGMSIDFLNRLGELVATAVRRFQTG